MSSISGNGNGSGVKAEDPVLRAKNRERETATKHKEDVEGLRAAHKEELGRLKSTHEENEKKIQERHKVTLSERDVQHQREIQALRDLYEKRRRSNDGSETA